MLDKPQTAVSTVLVRHTDQSEQMKANAVIQLLVAASIGLLHCTAGSCMHAVPDRHMHTVLHSSVQKTYDEATDDGIQCFA